MSAANNPQSARPATHPQSALRFLAPLILALALTVAVPQRASAASFNCAMASSEIETAICASPQVSKLDSELGAAFGAALASSSEPNALREAQRNWLNGTRNACADEACLAAAYAQRIQALRPAGSDARTDSLGIPGNKTPPYLIDRTETLSAQETASVAGILAKLTQSGVVAAVIVVDSTGSATVADYADRLGNQWNGRADQPAPQIIIAVAKSDQTVRISVNRDLNAAITDDAAAAIVSEAMIPQLRSGALGLALIAALDRIQTLVTHGAARAASGFDPSATAQASSAADSQAVASPSEVQPVQKSGDAPPIADNSLLGLSSRIAATLGGSIANLALLMALVLLTIGAIVAFWKYSQKQATASQAGRKNVGPSATGSDATSQTGSARTSGGAAAPSVSKKANSLWTQYKSLFWREKISFVAIPALAIVAWPVACLYLVIYLGIGFARKCPSCKVLFGRVVMDSEVVGQDSGYETVVRRDEVRVRTKDGVENFLTGGKHVGNVIRQEQVRVTYTTSRVHFECCNCDHHWTKLERSTSS